MPFHRFPLLPRVVLALGLALPTTGALSPVPARAAEIRAEVGQPLQAARDLIGQKKYQEALARIHEAEKVGGLSPVETDILNRLRGSAAAGAGDYALAARSFAAVIDTPATSDEDRARLTQAVIGLDYQAKDYGETVRWGERYAKSGGTDGQTRLVVAQARYLTGDYPGAVRDLGQLIQAEEKSGQSAPESQFRLLADSRLKAGDEAGYVDTLERLASAYPKPDYWRDLLHRVQSRPGFPDRLSLDASRLALAAGILTAPDDLVEFAELAIQAGLPGEAKTALDKGFGAGLLGTGPEADRQNRLRALAETRAAADKAGLDQSVAEARTRPDGSGLINTGLDYVGQGQPAAGVPLIEQGIAKGGLKHPDDARLHLGIAYLAAGETQKAVETFKTVGGTDGTADLARLWLAFASRKS